MIGEAAEWNMQIDPDVIGFYMQGSRLADQFKHNNFWGLFSMNETTADGEEIDTFFNGDDAGQIFNQTGQNGGDL